MPTGVEMEPSAAAAFPEPPELLVPEVPATTDRRSSAQQSCTPNVLGSKRRALGTVRLARKPGE